MRGLVAVVAALLALAPAAHADVTIGSDLAAAPDEPLAFDVLCLTAAPVGATAPFSGVITRWRVRVGTLSTPARLRVLRPDPPSFEVERALGCRGEVTVRRRRTTRTVALNRNCTYAARLPRGRGRVRARFAGNPVVEPAT